MKRINWSHWNWIFILTCLIFITLVGAINYIVDPLWCFNHDVVIGRFQPMFEERQQKTDWLTFHNNDFEAVILGNSRVTYMNHNDFPWSTYNYSASSLDPDEYPDYLGYACSQTDSEVKYVVLGMSFGSTNGSNNSSFSDPKEYIVKANSHGFRWRSLLSIGLLRYSLSCIKKDFNQNPHNAYIRYDGDISSKQMVLPIPSSELEKITAKQLNTYKNKVYGKNYKYQSNISIYKKLKESFPKVKFIVFTTPVTHNLLELLIHENRMDDYERWISELVSEFGSVWNFMYFNSITENNNLFKDAHHYSPEVCKSITEKISDQEYHGPEDFGLLVNSNNLNYHLKWIRRNFANQGR